MTTAVSILEKQMAPLAPAFAQVLGHTMAPERLIRTVMVSVERLPKLLECDRQSLFNAAMSAAVLGLEVDGVTGQAFLIPFKNKAQLVIGYKGYNTLAARSGITITGAVVREGDAFDYQLGTGAFVRHRPLMEGRNRRIIAAWACATSMDRPAIPAVMGIDELMAVKAKSPGGQRSDSPWNDPAIGFPAMCEKTVKRRLARSLPLNVMQLAARMDEAVDEQGVTARIDPQRGVVIDGEVVEPSPTPTLQDLTSPHRPPQNDAADQAAPAMSPSSLAGAAEVHEDAIERLERIDRELDAAAAQGWKPLKARWEQVSDADVPTFQAAMDNRHKPKALGIERARKEAADAAQRAAAEA